MSRNDDNLTGWQTAMGEKSDVRFCLYLNCPLKVCEERIMERSKTSGRTDDNLGSYIEWCIAAKISVTSISGIVNVWHI